MNPETLLAEVGHKMLRAAQGQTGMIRIVWLNGDFQCLTKSDARPTEGIIAKLGADTIQNGLTSKQWANLSNLLHSFWRLKKL